jgi:N6-adenosine-specific RNA methylase IME4|tara:strand:- start:1520 stop:2053 length:534 start_codon:yes stop_codon:yes gene_type:complete
MNYNVILADPPWTWKSWSKKGDKKSATQHYKTMEQADIYNLAVADLASDNSVCFLWCINTLLPQSFRLLNAWGFQYKTVGYVWVKQNRKTDSLFMGLGYHTRQNAELCLIGTRGKPKRISKGVHQIIMAPRREHSRKPDEIYSRIEQLYPGPYLELFSRTNRDGWDSIGDETGRWEA